MKSPSWQVIVYIILGIGISILISIIAAYLKAYFFGGIEEETFIMYVIVLLIIFIPLGIIVGKRAENNRNSPSGIEH